MPSLLVLDQPSTPHFSTDGKPTDDIRSLDVVLGDLNRFVKEMDAHGVSRSSSWSTSSRRTGLPSVWIDTTSWTGNCTRTTG
ncbi:hypothetical protein LMG31506_06324 [Cupriavidus yeoncheonensis]|uniref:Uncharacterized protein n=1 Tax=Cupriavidus yeoncheonensis TaxID=1462994 RepID=A0A916J116_9BURK|nr:hypothetical protein [Cupriavidus yeoncheonensis]CAG2158313.1 hypothetical protein LMG31506_06324 [Cupriavidus yeoncheonensis]